MYPQSKLAGAVIATATSNSTVSAVFDTLGFHRAQITIVAKGLEVTNPPVKLSLSECDTSNGTTAAISELTYGTATNNVTAVNNASGTATVVDGYRWSVELRGRKRYLFPYLTLSAEQGTTVGTVAITCDLFGSEDIGTETQAKQGCKQLIEG